MADVDEPVRLAAHEPAWVGRGADLVRRLTAALSGLPVDVAHIGSTAVPGLAAKPVIDVQVGSPPSDTGEVVARLVRAGFEHLGQAGVPGREYLRRRGGASANVHVVERRGRLWDDNILLRDHLAADADAAARYERAKLRAARTAATLLAYSDAKEQAVRALIAEAHAAAARSAPIPDGTEAERPQAEP